MAKTTMQQCRACLIEQDHFSYFICSTLEPIFIYCTSIEVTPEDSFTKALCNDCYEKLKGFHEFRLLCQESHFKLLCGLPKTNRDTEENIKIEYLENNNHEDNIVSDMPFEMAIEYDDNTEVKLGCSPLLKAATKRDRKCHNPYLFSCIKCKKKYIDPDRFEAHLQTHKGNTATEIKCKECDKSFLTWSGFSRHKKSVHLPVTLDQLKCQVCGKVSKSRHSLKMHQQRMHGDRRTVVCDMCGREFSNTGILKAHLETHNENRPRSYECQECGNKYFNSGNLAQHKARCHDNRRYICNYCQHVFRNKASLTDHIQVIHEGKREHKCDLCSREFSTKFNLVIHKRIHSGERPYACSFCPKRFINKRRLVDHHRMHTKERPHKCHVCSQAFTQKGTLNRHAKIHAKSLLVKNADDNVQLI